MTRFALSRGRGGGGDLVADRISQPRCDTLPLIGRLHRRLMWTTCATSSRRGRPTASYGYPGMPGYGVLAFAGTFVFGRMGILPEWCSFSRCPSARTGWPTAQRPRVQSRAHYRCYRVCGHAVGFNMISQGRVDVLIVVASLPFIVRRIFELMEVPGFRLRPYGEPVPLAIGAGARPKPASAWSSSC